MTTSKADALAAVTKATARLARTQRDASARQEERDRAILAAQGAGATYPELARAAGVTRDRIRQVLADMRKQRSAEQH